MGITPMQVTFQTRGIKSMFHSITSAQFAWNKCRVITVMHVHSNHVGLIYYLMIFYFLPNDFLLLIFYLGVYSDFDITLETSSLQGRHIKERADTLSDNTYVRACSFFHSAGHERYRCCLLHKAQDEFSSTGKASCLVVFLSILELPELWF